jgi:DNA primase
MDKSLKEQVLESVDIVDVVGEHVALTRRGREYVGLCPFHNDHRPSMNVSPQKQIFKCWSCGAGGDVIRFVELFNRVDFKEALAILARRAGIELRSAPVDHEASRQREQLLAVAAWAKGFFRENLETLADGREARAYALKRGLTPETIDRFELGFAADDWKTLLHAAQRRQLSPTLLAQAGLVATNERGNTYDRFRNRLVFPIADAQGRPIAFGGRALGDDPAKYLNSPETVLFSKSRVLYGFDLARRAIEQQKAVIVVEGYMDAVMLHQFGFEHAVATLGTALTDAHAKLLRARAEVIYLCFDGDDAGMAAANRAVEVALRTQADVRVVLLPGGQDPADCLLASGAEGMAEQLKGSLDALEFKWSQTLSAFGRGGQTARRAAVEEYLQFVAGATLAGGVDPLQQHMLIGRLGDLLGIPSETVFDLMARSRRAQRRPAASVDDRAATASDYKDTIRGLPAGLVTATETVLGLLVADWRCWQWIDDLAAQAVAYSQTWKQLYRILLEVHEDEGEYSIGQVMARCEEAAVCELVSRARARVAGVTALEDDFAAAHAALKSEMGVLQVGGLRANLQQAGGDDADVFRLLRENARAQHSPLPAESRLNAAP